MDDPDFIKAWARTTLNKCVEDAVEIHRVPEVKRDEVLALIHSLVDQLFHGTDSDETHELRKSVRRRGGAVPFIGGYQ